MTGAGEEFEVKLGRIRSPSGARRAAGFLRRFSRAAQVGAGRSRRPTGGRHAGSRSRFFRRVIVKARIVKMAGANARRHLDYIERNGTGSDEKPARLYDANSLEADKDLFLERSKNDRHQFRFIVSAEDAHELQDLTAFTRDLVREMESDLGAKLEWVAADHYDTGQPHTHLIVRGRREDGSDLVIPKRYISFGLRERAQELAELELGPVTEIDGRNRFAHMVDQERMTELDRKLIGAADNGAINLRQGFTRAKPWERQLLKRRLTHLKKMGLAESFASGRWRLNDSLAPTLRRLGERGDIIKSLHRAMTDGKSPVALDASAIFDPSSEGAKNVTGAVINKGVADDTRNSAFLVIDSIDGKPVYVEIGAEDRLEEFSKGDIVTVRPNNFAPRKSDLTIADIADANNGRYSSVLHMAADNSARPEFVAAHIRRLEALRRAGHVTRRANGEWQVPADYLDRASAYEREGGARRPVNVEQQSPLRLSQMKTVIGATWLDRRLADDGVLSGARGFGAKVEAAKTERRLFLISHGVMTEHETRLSREGLSTLEARDLAAAGEALSIELGKRFAPAPASGRIAGTYRLAIDRPSGKYAIIERAKDFSLVPWRDVLERNRGRPVAGIMRRGRISWTLTGGRGVGR